VEKPLDLTQFQIQFLKICLQTFITCCIYSLNIALNNAKSQLLGKLVLQYYCKKKVTQHYSLTIDQLSLQIPYINFLPAHSPQFSLDMVKNTKYYMTAKKALGLNAALLDNFKLFLALLKMLNSQTKTYFSFILALKMLLDPLIMPAYLSL
jgi:hypothetical protein